MLSYFRSLAGCLSMSYEAEKDLLEKATTTGERVQAVEDALAVGMPLSLIEEFLDWLELRNSQSAAHRPA